LRSKKKSKKTKLVGSSPLTPEDQEFIASLLRELDDTDPAEIADRVPDSRRARIVIDTLPIEHKAFIPLLIILKQAFSDKQVQKAIKRAAYRLKTRGTDIRDLSPAKEDSPPILRPVKKERPEAYLGPVDMDGYRAILVILHRVMRGVEICVGLVSDEYGFRDFVLGATGKRHINEMKDHLSRETGPLVESSLSHVFTVLEDAYKSHLELHPESPPDYLELRSWLLENAPLLERPEIYNHIPDESPPLGSITASRLDELFEHDLMQSWLIDFEHLRPFMEDILKAENSPILLTEAQKSDHIRQIKERCLQELFPAAKRTLLRHRLEEMAYVFFKLDEEKYSRLSLASAQSVNENGSTIWTNPLIEFLLERSIDYYMDRIEKASGEEARKVESSPRIVLP